MPEPMWILEIFKSVKPNEVDLNTFFMSPTCMHPMEGPQKPLSQHQDNSSSPTGIKLLKQCITLPRQLKSTLYSNVHGERGCQIKEDIKSVFYFHFLFTIYFKEDSICFFHYPFSAFFFLRQCV